MSFSTIASPQVLSAQSGVGVSYTRTPVARKLPTIPRGLGGDGGGGRRGHHQARGGVGSASALSPLSSLSLSLYGGCLSPTSYYYYLPTTSPFTHSAAGGR